MAILRIRFDDEESRYVVNIRRPLVSKKDTLIETGDLTDKQLMDLTKVAQRLGKERVVELLKCEALIRILERF